MKRGRSPPTPVLNLSNPTHPMYIADDVKHFVDEYIREPIQHPEIFNDFVPVRRTFFIYGRQGVGKEQMLCQLLEQRNISYLVHTMVPGLVDTCYSDLLEILKERVATRVDPVVIIITKGDLLVTGTDNSRVLRESTQLESLVRGTNNFLVVLSDVPPAGQSAIQSLFFKQFDKRVFVPSPDPEFRSLYLEYLLKTQMLFIQSLPNVHVTLDLLPQDYQWLSTVSAHCTIKQMHQWVRNLFYTYQHADRKPVIINRVLLEDENNRHITRASGVLSITAESCTEEERQFSQHSGKGVQPSVQEEEEQLDEIIPTRVSAFQEKNVETTAAWAELEQKRAKLSSD